MKFTLGEIAKFRAPKDKADHIEWFDGSAGFGLRVRQNGSKEKRSFVYQFRIGGQHRRMQLGDGAVVTTQSLGTVHAAYTAAHNEVIHGRDPQAGRIQVKADTVRKATEQRLARSFGQAVAEYLEMKAQKVRPRSLYVTRLYLERYCEPLHPVPIKSVDKGMIADRLRTMAKENGAVTADRGRAALSAFFGWAVGEDYVQVNPVIGTNRAAASVARERVLTDAELVAIWKAAPDSDFGAIVRLLILTGQRRNELGQLATAEMQPEARQIVLAADRVKNGREHDVPLSDDAMAILLPFTQRAQQTGRSRMFGEGKLGFSAWSKGKNALDKASGVSDWTLHDLRRTWATRAGDSGVQPHVIEAVLNHVSGHKAGVAGVYNRATYAAEKRAAMETVANYIKVAIAKADGSNVSRLMQRATHAHVVARSNPQGA